MPEAIFSDIDPAADLAGMAEWVMRAADFWHEPLQRHPDWHHLKRDARTTALSMAATHGYIVGAKLGVREVRVHECVLSEAKITKWKEEYRHWRLLTIHRLCEFYIRGWKMDRDLSSFKGGKPLKLLPDYTEKPPPPTNPKAQVKWKSDRFEADIAVKLFNKKVETGRYSGIDDLLNEATQKGLISSDGDPRQRVLRLAKRLFEQKDLYVTPGLQAALDGADRWSLTDRGF